MKIATFNINGIKARQDALTDWLVECAPDVACLQEIKSLDENFPRAHFEALGYRVETHGQKSFNGVAILSKLPLENVTRGLPGDAADEQARWIEATVVGSKRCALAVCICRTATPHRGRNTTTNSPGWRGCRPMSAAFWHLKCRWCSVAITM